MTPDIEALYQSIGTELVSIPGEPFEGIALYAEAEEGVMSADVLYVAPGASRMTYRVGSPLLTDLLFELWEQWRSLPGQQPWRALLYAVKGRKFDIKLTYADQFEEHRAEAERRLLAVQPVLGKDQVDYSRA